jgi:hypothetical protein
VGEELLNGKLPEAVFRQRAVKSKQAGGWTKLNADFAAPVHQSISINPALSMP